MVRHMKALPHREVAAAVEKVQTSDSLPVVKLAFEFLVLTAARWGEVRWAVWPEMDRREGVWTVPATRIRAKREHRVPLSGRALEILDETRRLGRGGPIVFARGRGREVAEKQVRQMLGRGSGIAAVPHGFRSSLRDWTAEETDHPREVVEAALEHIVKNKVEAAYMRSDLFERRCRLMAEWSEYVAGRRAGFQDLAGRAAACDGAQRPFPGAPEDLRGTYGPARRRWCESRQESPKLNWDCTICVSCLRAMSGSAVPQRRGNPYQMAGLRLDTGYHPGKLCRSGSWSTEYFNVAESGWCLERVVPWGGWSDRHGRGLTDGSREPDEGSHAGTGCHGVTHSRFSIRR